MGRLKVNAENLCQPTFGADTCIVPTQVIRTPKYAGVSTAISPQATVMHFPSNRVGGSVRQDKTFLVDLEARNLLDFDLVFHDDSKMVGRVGFEPT